MSPEFWQLFGGDEDLDGASFSRGSLDQAGPFEVENHLVDARRGDLEVLLDVGLGWGPAVDLCLDVNEGQVLALLFGEAWLERGVTGTGGLIHQGFFQQGGHDEHTILRRVEPIGA